MDPQHRKIVGLNVKLILWQETSMFRWPEAVERRDSIFGEPTPAARKDSSRMRHAAFKPHITYRRDFFYKQTFNKCGRRK